MNSQSANKICNPAIMYLCWVAVPQTARLRFQAHLHPQDDRFCMTRLASIAHSGIGESYDLRLEPWSRCQTSWYDRHDWYDRFDLLLS
jgi:hypothetical protein